MALPARQDSGLPGLPALREVCRNFGADSTGARLLHQRSNAVYLLPHDHLVVRLAPDTPVRRRRAQTCVDVTRWLATQPEPIALAPAASEQPVLAAGAVATFWPHRPTTPAPSLADLAVPLRHLHALPAPPFPVARYEPLQRLFEAMDLDQHRPHPAVDADDRSWLLDRAHALVDTFTSTAFLEHDTGTESLVKVTGKLDDYAAFPTDAFGVLLLSVHSARREIALRAALRRALAGNDPGFVIATAARDGNTFGHGDGPAGPVWGPVCAAGW